MHCTKCGKKLPGDAEFCPNCGAAVGPEVSLFETAAERLGMIVFCSNIGLEGLLPS